MPVDAHLPRAIPTAAVVAGEVRVVVLGRVRTDRMFELGYHCQGGEGPSAVLCRADDTFGRDVGEGRGYAFEEEGVFARTAFER